MKQKKDVLHGAIKNSKKYRGKGGISTNDPNGSASPLLNPTQGAAMNPVTTDNGQQPSFTDLLMNSMGGLMGSGAYPSYAPTTGTQEPGNFTGVQDSQNPYKQPTPQQIQTQQQQQAQQQQGQQQGQQQKNRSLPPRKPGRVPIGLNRTPSTTFQDKLGNAQKSFSRLRGQVRNGTM